MKTCPNCQHPVNDNEMFCPNCGTRVDAQQNPNNGYGQQGYAQQQYSQPNYQQPYNQPNYNQQQYNQPNYQQPYGQQGYGYQAPRPTEWFKTTGQLIWSIINLLFCCMPLGIWGLILATSVNKKATYEEAAKSMKTLKIVNLIATIAGGIFEIVYIVIMIASAASSSFYY